MPEYQHRRLELLSKLIKFSLPASLGHQFVVQVSLELGKLPMHLSSPDEQGINPSQQVSISPLLFKGDLLTAQELNSEYSVVQKKRFRVNYMLPKDKTQFKLT